MILVNPNMKACLHCMRTKHDISKEIYRGGKPGWLRGLAQPSAQGVISESQDLVPVDFFRNVMFGPHAM